LDFGQRKISKADLADLVPFYILRRK